MLKKKGEIKIEDEVINMPTVSNENTYIMKLSTFYKEFLNAFYKSFKGITLVPLF